MANFMYRLRPNSPEHFLER